MALTQNNCEMIKAIAENNMFLAKKAAIASCVEDGSKKNAWFTQKYEKILCYGSASSILENIPPNLKWKLAGELPENFNKEHYYLSERERTVYEKIYRMKIVAQQMQELGITYRNATLLHGASGTGKTMFGRYVAHRLQMPYFYLNFSQMVDSYLGGTASNIHNAFNYIKEVPCVFMIDEIDCIAGKRSNRGGKGPDGEIERTTISIMQELDSLPNNVVLIAATNRKDLLDEAILRRFSVIHEVKPLTQEEDFVMVRDFMEDVNRKLEKTGNRIKMPESEIEDIIEKERTPAHIMNEVIQRLGTRLYKEVSGAIPENPWIESEQAVSDEAPVYEVTFSTTYKVTTSQGKEDAVRKARALQAQGIGYGTQRKSKDERIDVIRI